MREKIKQMITAALIGGVVAALVFACSGSSDESPASTRHAEIHGEEKGDPGPKAHHENGGHEEDAGPMDESGHRHGEAGSSDLSMSMDEIASARCEHNMPAYQCDACRYEVGVVKVPQSLLKDDSPEGKGLIRTQRAAKRTVTAGLKFTGEIQMNENTAVHLSPRIPGIIESVHVDMGTRVKAGEILFKINSVELGKALSDYERSLALTDLSRKSFEREKSLFERDISSEQDMIEAQMVYERHKTDLRAARQALQVLGLTEKDLEKMKGSASHAGTGCLSVRAPIEGTIIEKHAVIGELVEPGGDVMLLADLRTIWAWADIYERDLRQLLEAEKKGPIPVGISVRAFPARIFEGRIDYIGATMNEQTRTVKVRAIVQNPDRLLRPGMFCDIQVGAGRSEQILAVPKTALLSDDGDDFVFIHWKEDYYVRRPVTRGRTFFEDVEILEGLEPGENIVFSDSAFLLKSDILREKMGAGCAD